LPVGAPKKRTVEDLRRIAEQAAAPPGAKTGGD